MDAAENLLDVLPVIVVLELPKENTPDTRFLKEFPKEPIVFEIQLNTEEIVFCIELKIEVTLLLMPSQALDQIFCAEEPKLLIAF